MSSDTSKRILIIEDDPQVRKILELNLKRLGHEVIVTPEGKQGLRAFIEKGADLVITDIIMPEKDGIETIRELRLIDQNVKIMAISGGGRIGPEGYLKTASYLGADFTLEKPFQREDLYQAVKCLLFEV